MYNTECAGSVNTSFEPHVTFFTSEMVRPRGHGTAHDTTRHFLSSEMVRPRGHGTAHYTKKRSANTSHGNFFYRLGVKLVQTRLHLLLYTN